MQQTLTTTAISQPLSKSIIRQSRIEVLNIIKTSLAWCEAQQESRLLWMGLAFLGLTIFAIPCIAMSYWLLGINNFNLWIITFVVNVPVLAINLAAQPTKVTLPALFFSWAINLTIILSTIVMALVG